MTTAAALATGPDHQLIADWLTTTGLVILPSCIGFLLERRASRARPKACCVTPAVRS